MSLSLTAGKRDKKKKPNDEGSAKRKSEDEEEKEPKRRNVSGDDKTEDEKEKGEKEKPKAQAQAQGPLFGDSKKRLPPATHSLRDADPNGNERPDEGRKSFAEAAASGVEKGGYNLRRSKSKAEAKAKT